MNRLVNTTVLSNFAATQALDLLRDTAGPLYLPNEVYDEIAAGQMAGYAFYDGIERMIVPLDRRGWLHLIAMTDEELALATTLPGYLHRGEVACLCIARQRGWGFLTDDRAARRQAQQWKIPISGTLGVLVLTVQDARLTVHEANALLMAMIVKAHYRSPVSDIGDLLAHS